MAIKQLSIPSGWQKGMSSWVRFAPMTPATMAVSKIGPLLERSPLSRSAAATEDGKCTRASAIAVRLVAVLSLTSTMVGRRSASKCEKVMLAADVVHLDLLFIAGSRRAERDAPQLAVAIVPPLPGAADHLQELIVGGTGTHRLAQIETLRCEKTGIKLSFRGQSRTRTIPAKRLGNRGDEPDLTGAVVELPAFRHLAAIVLEYRMDGPTRIDAVGELARRHHHLRAPGIAIADIHELYEAHDHGLAAEILQEIEHRVIVHAALDHRIDLDRSQTRRESRVDAVQDLIERREPAAHAREHLSIQGIEAHGHALQAVGLQVHRVPSEQHAVRSEGDVLDLGDDREVADQVGEIRTQQRLAPGETELAHAEVREQARESRDLLERQALLRLQEAEMLVELTLRHAIRAAKIAAIHDRYTQVVQRTPAAVERVSRSLNVMNVGLWRIHRVTSGTCS